jgi:hypothetical protein
MRLSFLLKSLDYNGLLELLISLQRELALSNDQVLIQSFNLNPKDKGSISTIENEGAIAGPNWADYNESKFIRLTIKKPIDKCGSLYIFHLLLAFLLNAHFDTLVGYKYKGGEPNRDVENSIWTIKKYSNFIAGKGIKFDEYRLLPKHLTEPVKYILDFLENKKVNQQCLKT